jgi:uncharacterized radical SAM superfamily Fe-S cluster-containing enzyme
MQQLEISSLKDVSVPFALDKTVYSLCPSCLMVINAEIFQENDAIVI